MTWADLTVRYTNTTAGARVYNELVRSGCKDYVTFNCRHVDMDDDGRAHFRSMQAEHGVAPGPDQYMRP
jgi:hypothetical protein